MVLETGTDHMADARGLFENSCSGVSKSHAKTDGEVPTVIELIEAVLLEFPICHRGLEAAW